MAQATRSGSWTAALALSFLAEIVAGCSDSAGPGTGCAVDRDCPDGQRCVAGTCQPGEEPDAGDGEDGEDGADGGDGAPCTPGAREPCGSDVGTCQIGERTCEPGGTWSECVGEVPPAEEICDGLDNDCDGIPDDDPPPPPGVCLDLGVCAATVPFCAGLRWSCDYPATHEPGREASCDGLDNDCDGEIDEELTPPSGLCPTVGVCRDGAVPACQGASGWGCDFPGTYEPGEEVSCDGLDNDCDFAVDEGLHDAPPGTCLDEGICASASARCQAGAWVCDYPVGYQPSGENVCDGQDNDCDGAVDEDLQGIGVCLSAGVCLGTIGRCVGGGWVCDYPPTYSDPDVTCDGVDNDCDGAPDTDLVCGGVCCDVGEICHLDLCLPDLGPCATDDDCQGDSYCDAFECIPYGVGPRDETNPDCTRLVVAGLFQPALQCEWLAPSAGDYDAHVQVLGTPAVADFDLDGDPLVRKPSLVFLTYDGTDGDSGIQTTLDGVLRIVDGETCQTQFSLGPYLNGSNPPAIGDLDLDGRPEIVVHRNTGSALAYRYDPALQAWGELWVGHDAAGTPLTYGTGDPPCATDWGGPSLVDLDDDARPEILSGGLIYSPDGLLLDDHLGLGVLYLVGFPVAADADRDGAVELVGGNGMWQYDPATHTWVAEWTQGTTARGYAALADFGTYGAEPLLDDRGTLDGVAEIATVGSGLANLVTVTGRVIMTVALPGSTGGGPPTIGDFDGDGRAELAAAGSDSLTIFDLDCHGAIDPAFCAPGGPGQADYILWSQPSQDHSSNRTGSSLFDFEGDGPVEAVYADECFVRVYRGLDGKVLYSRWRSSCTWNENPIVADVDGDFTAELVVPSNQSCGTAPSSMGGQTYPASPHGAPMDPLFAGLPCLEDADCLSAVCDAGYCRCVDDAGCGGGGFVCAPPPAWVGGAHTCRAEWQGSISGLRVYRDSLDRWVGSRSIWNQHAYAITNVSEDGVVPRTSAAVGSPNWTVPGLNNFRQNIQGDLRPDHSPDMTAGLGTFDPRCDAQGALPLHVRVCNRGTNPVGAGVAVGFFDGDPDQGGALVCSAPTTHALQPGECETVTCLWADAPIDTPTDLTVVVDWDEARSECLEGNNRGLVLGATCPYH